MGSKSRRKRRGRDGRRHTAAPGAPPKPAVEVQIPKPHVTSYTVTTVVPVFGDGDAGPARGSPGAYDVILILGIPGRTSVSTSFNLDPQLAGGDSLLLSSGLELLLDDGKGTAGTAQVVRNRDGRLAQVRASVEADDFAAAERRVHDLVAPSLSLLAFQADAAVEISGVLLTELATQIKRYGATMVGTFKSAPAIAGQLSEEVRPSLASYRDGLNANSPLHQALSFYKVLEHSTALTTQRRRQGSRRGQTPAADPMQRHVPLDLADLPDQLEFERMVFPAYLGLSYADVQSKVIDTIRNAVAHLTPRRDVRSADLLDDVQACRDVVPVLRYIARDLITEELGRS